VGQDEFAEGLEPVELLVRTGLATSKAEARRYVEQGGVYVNNRRLGANELVDATRALHGKYLVIRRGVTSCTSWSFRDQGRCGLTRGGTAVERLRHPKRGEGDVGLDQPE